MSTYIQLSKKKKIKRKKKNRVKALKGNPQKKGICMKMIIMTPKKPNSAKRKVAWIRLFSKKFVFGYIPGEGHNLQKYSNVLIRGGLIRDLPGVHYTIIRGKLDLMSIRPRRQGRSKYGTKIWWKPKKRDKLSARAKHKKGLQYIIAKKARFRRAALRLLKKMRFNLHVCFYKKKKEKQRKKYRKNKVFSAKKNFIKQNSEKIYRNKKFIIKKIDSNKKIIKKNFFKINKKKDFSKIPTKK
jgi:small subunit ribosomal protein S12